MGQLYNKRISLAFSIYGKDPVSKGFVKFYNKMTAIIEFGICTQKNLREYNPRDGLLFDVVDMVPTSEDNLEQFNSKMARIEGLFLKHKATFIYMYGEKETLKWEKSYRDNMKKFMVGPDPTPFRSVNLLPTFKMK